MRISRVPRPGARTRPASADRSGAQREAIALAQRGPGLVAPDLGERRLLSFFELEGLRRAVALAVGSGEAQPRCRKAHDGGARTGRDAARGAAEADDVRLLRERGDEVPELVIERGEADGSCDADHVRGGGEAARRQLSLASWATTPNWPVSVANRSARSSESTAPPSGINRVRPPSAEAISPDLMSRSGLFPESPLGRRAGRLRRAVDARP